MIIKLYTRGAVNHLHIIENVTRVKVHGGNNHCSRLFVDGLVNPFELEHLDHTNEPCKAIQFERTDGQMETLLVFNKAYICNDDGKTIETVRVEVLPDMNCETNCKEEKAA